MYRISVALPCYEMHGRGVEMLNFSLGVFEKQTYKNFEVVVSDESENTEIKDLCDSYKNKIDLVYSKNLGKKGISGNPNNAIKSCTGDIIKILCQDDFLFDENSLQKTVDNFDFDKKWLVSSYFHTDINRITRERQQFPKWDNEAFKIKKVYRNNLIGNHSCLSFINNKNDPIFFDEDLIYLMDCEIYYRLFLKYGEPKILNEATVVQCIWKGQVSQTIITNEMMGREEQYLMGKYENKTN